MSQISALDTLLSAGATATGSAGSVGSAGPSGDVSVVDVTKRHSTGNKICTFFFSYYIYNTWVILYRNLLEFEIVFGSLCSLHMYRFAQVHWVSG